MFRGVGPWKKVKLMHKDGTITTRERPPWGDHRIFLVPHLAYRGSLGPHRPATITTWHQRADDPDVYDEGETEEAK